MKPENLVQREERPSITIKELEIFNYMPFLFFIKDEAGKYLWSNQAVAQLAKGSIVGKTDYELMSADTAEALRVIDRQVWETEKSCFLQEVVEAPDRGKVPLRVCKFVGELDNQKCLMGVAFIIE